MTRKTTPPTEKVCQAMLRAASVMPAQQATEHVTSQALLLFDQHHAPLAVAELELSEAKKELDRLSETLDALRHERRKIPHLTYFAHEQNEEDGNE